jgi:hypothetical protein
MLNASERLERRVRISIIIFGVFNLIQVFIGLNNQHSLLRNSFDVVTIIILLLLPLIFILLGVYSKYHYLNLIILIFDVILMIIFILLSNVVFVVEKL